MSYRGNVTENHNEIILYTHQETKIKKTESTKY